MHTIQVSEHPFYSISKEADYREILANFLAMSQAFPYLQSGSHTDLAWSYIKANQDIPREVELTSVVGTFLCWDEMGAFYKTLSNGINALPQILNTSHFHSNMLKKDCKRLLNEDLEPHFSAETRTYLLALYEGLSSADHVKRVAHMVAFETHAGIMILALWDALAKHFNYPKEKLTYFNLHVGEYDPKEIYHVEMTNRLIEEVVSAENRPAFDEEYKKALMLNVNWCQDVVSLSMNVLDPIAV